jgi:hypothetical protein
VRSGPPAPSNNSLGEYYRDCVLCAINCDGNLLDTSVQGRMEMTRPVLVSCSSRVLLMCRHRQALTVLGIRSGKLAGRHRSQRSLSTGFSGKTNGSSSNKDNNKPIILLDIDGVLNMLGHQLLQLPDAKKLVGWPEIKTGNVHYPLKKPFNFPFAWAPALIEKLNSWAQNNTAEIRWLTTWDNYAKTNVAPVLGLSEFIVARDPALNLSKLTAATTIATAEPSRPIVWIDDDLTAFFHPNDVNSIKYWGRRGSTFLIQTNYLFGLLPSDIERIDLFLRNPASSQDNFKGMIRHEGDAWLQSRRGGEFL